MTILSLTNLPLVAACANEKLTKCKITRKSSPQRLSLPPPTFGRLFPQYRHRGILPMVSTSGTEAALEQSPPQSDAVSPPGSATRSKRVRPTRKSEMPPVKDEELIPGAVFTGKVRSIQAFGAFIDFGAFTEGLVHVSRLSDSYVKDVGSVVSVGQEVKVKLLEANLENGRISLSMRENEGASRSQKEASSPASERPKSARKAAPARPKAETKNTKYAVGQELRGTVKNIVRAGSFIALGEGEEGFLPMSEEGGDGYSHLMGESTLEAGQEVTVRVLRISRGQLTLTMKTEEDDDSKMDMEQGEGVVHKPTNPFALAFRNNKELSAFLDQRQSDQQLATSNVGVAEPAIEHNESAPAIDATNETDAVISPVGSVEAALEDNEPEAAIESDSVSQDAVAAAVDATNETAAVSQVGHAETLEIQESVNNQSEIAATDGVVSQVEEPTNEQEVTNAVAEATNEEEVTNAVAEATNEEEVTSGVAEATNEEEVTNAVAEPTNEEEVTNAVAEPTNEEEVTNAVAESTNEEEVTSGVAEATNEEEVTNEVAATEATNEGVTSEVAATEAAKSNQGNISPALVKRLREESGAGMMDCKKALAEAEGDVAKAQEILRKKGLASAEKKASRATSQGRIGSYIHDSRIGVLVEVNCETDFVSRGEIFKSLVDDLAMQVAACPLVQVLSPEDVPESTVQKETEIEMQKEDLQSKPEQFRAKIVEGRMRKRLEEVSLLEQPYIKNDKMTVKDLVSQSIATVGENIKVGRFIRYNLGEGLERKSQDFAAEVAAQTAAKTEAAPAHAPALAPETPKQTDDDTHKEPVVAVSAALVKQLREETGAGMMDCKKALSETGGDIEKAQEYLRKKGLSAADKKSSRLAAEGRVGSYIHDARIGVLIEVNCETDFVGRSETFKQLVDDLAMQVVACPGVQFVSMEDVPESTIEKEKEIERQREDLQAKPENMRERIVEGRVNKRLGELALLEQPFIKDDTVLVKDLVKKTVAALGENIKVRRFDRFTLGEAPETTAQVSVDE